ncbi:MAG: HDIG domain-containing protein, partial [Opitutaceae bacterium]|nr:HDIG domain-containing protein [Opitutaceae bacterium]
MSIFSRFRGSPSAPRKRKTARRSGIVEFFQSSRVVAALIFFLTVAAIVAISFVGIRAVNLPVLPNQIASVRIVASESFSYQSAEKTRLAREQIRNRVPRVYRLDFDGLRRFESAVQALLGDLEKLDADHPRDAARPASQNSDGDTAAHGSPGRRAALAAIVNAFNARGPYHAGINDIRTLLDYGDAPARRALVESSLVVLRGLHQEGIHDESPLFATAGSPGQVSVFRISRSGGFSEQHTVQSLGAAERFLRINLETPGTDSRTLLALFRIFHNGLAPNLVFDTEASARLQEETLKNLQPVVVQVERGQPIVEPGIRVTPEQYEMLEAHRHHLYEHSGADTIEALEFFRRILFVFAMVIACGVYIRIEDRETLQNNRRLALLALVVIANLSLIRFACWLGELPYFIQNSSIASLLPYAAPTAIAALLVAILIDTGSAIFVALVVSIFTSVIFGNRLDLLVVTFLSSMIGIFFCRQVRQRGRVVRAAVLGGIAVAIFAFFLGIIDQQPIFHPPFTVPAQMLAGLCNGLLTGIIVVGIIPVIEGLFKRTTDITLLELTDYNHPLLTAMQEKAPGTYHHSLAVARLAEDAAAAIGANPLLARVCALFHDIGKTGKPEYFTENQRDRANPHDENNPSLSALIIKAHVKDGVDLAIKHKLPRAVIDVIQQHHGTTLIRFFLQRALDQTRMHSLTAAPFILSPGGAGPSPAPSASKPSLPLTPTPLRPEHLKTIETTYRYDGPRPQFKESAIIHLADSLEAASRSLRRVTPQHLGELIDHLFAERIKDGQLDECPLTLAELAQIKASFARTLLNMLHSRIAYPPAAPEPKPA